ncbi:MAG: GIY-YIG nuclease family protein [Thermoplasmataceae archaeon]|jgi:hypothetical protein
MPNPFTIRIFIPEGEPEGLRIIDRQSSPSKFFVFPRDKWEQIKNRSELMGAGIYILTGYSDPGDELPTIYVGQADTISTRINQHIMTKDFWDRGIIFTSSTINSAHAKWLEYSLIKKVKEADRSIVDNGNSPQEPTISEAEKAEMQVFLNEIYQTLPIVGLRAFEKPKAVSKPAKETHKNENDTIVVPAQKEGFERVFLGENSWYAIRIGGGNLNKIKYIASYQSQPISAITHYAPIERIEPYGEEGKYKLVFSEPAKKLDRKIPFGNASTGSMQSPRYTNFEKLKKAREVKDLF